MPHEQPAADDSPTQDTAVPAPVTAGQAPSAYEPIEAQDEWLEEPGELPRRPRRRLLSPLPLALLGVLLAACGFIAGVLIEKGQASSTSSAGAASSLASRFAALRGSGSSSGSSAAAGGAGGGFAGRGAAAGSGAGGATAGQVAYLAGNTLYVTTAEGNTVKVTSSPATSVTKSVTTSVAGIHPGETVIVTGATGSNGAISAESIRVGAAGGGGLGALFSGAGTGAGAGSGGKAGGGGTGGGEPALFGGGG